MKLITASFSKNMGHLKSSFYVTTPIYYVNAAPHIGHLYSSVIADAAQRWQQLTRPESKIRFATGTDEHGTKIQQSAATAKCALQDYCDDISNKYRNLFDSFHINYTDFIRTTDEAHKKAVQRFWGILNENGHIYSSNYKGWYCVSDETFLTDSQLKEIELPNGEKTFISAESGHPVEWSEEPNYVFKLSSFQDDLKYWVTRNEDVVKPKVFRKILLDLISEEGLPDVSISRPSSRVHWGVRVPGDETQTVYVWLDALVNYLTVAGFQQTPENVFAETWPPDLQVIGKDILKFHGIYWPAFLMAANLDPPKSLLCHSHWTVDGEKMSKSRNNVVCPLSRSEIYTTEGFRYFLLREGVAHSDGNYSDTKVIRILNSELADTLGNLLSRCCGTTLNPHQLYPEIDTSTFQSIASLDVTKKLIESVNELPNACCAHYEQYNFYKVVDSVMSTLHAANLFFQTLKPWELRKRPERHQDLNAILHITMETLRTTAVILNPIIPNLSDSLLNKLNVPINRRSWESIQCRSWTDHAFRAQSLSNEKLVFFKRIILEDETRKKKSKTTKV